MASKFNTSPKDALHTGKLVHLALPVRWTLVGEEGHGPARTACTYDIHPRGARLLSIRKVSVGDLVVIERGRGKVICQVVWTADPASPLRGQFTVRCIEARTPWEDELRQMEERYQPVISNGQQRLVIGNASRPDANRRRRPRFLVEGQAEAVDGVQCVEAEVQQISEYGARIAGMDRPQGADFRLQLNVFDVTVSLKAQVKHLADNLAMGVEFQEIRLGDRPLLGYVLSKLRTRRTAELAGVEVVRQPLAGPAM